MRVRVLLLLIVVALVGGCRGAGEPSVVRASELRPTGSPSPSETVDPVEARLVELRATDQFDEFAEHERAAEADGARLAWENFAPIVDGQRVEWTNKAELWDSIAPKIRDEALLLGPEYRKPLWNNNTAVPNGVAMAWNDEDTEGRGHYVEFSVIYLSSGGGVERVWGFLVRRGRTGGGEVVASMAPVDFRESDFKRAADEFEAVQAHTWNWIRQQEVLAP